MKKLYNPAFGFALLALTLVASAVAQSGGNFAITKSVITSGGGASAGAGFGVSGTIGQPLIGLSSGGGSYTVYSGFWKPAFAATAASTTVSGRVVRSDGNGIPNAVLTLTAFDGTHRTATTATFGYYRFDDVAAGETYILGITAKRFTFANPTLTISVTDELTDIDFVAEELP